MRKFSIRIRRNLNVFYDHYLSDKFVKKEGCGNYFKRLCPLEYWSRGFDKPAAKWRSGSFSWCLDSKWHRIGKPAWIYSNGDVEYYENGEEVK